MENDKAKDIMMQLHKEGYLETIYNTKNPRYEDGWTLKSGAWSPVYLNLRPTGNSPELVIKIADEMNRMIRSEVPGVSQLVGIEMAGIPLVAAIGTARGEDCEPIRYSYTRALPGGKVRTPEEAKERLKNLDKFTYGGKEFVEGRFNEGEVICITDDLVTNFGSKIITKLMLEHELEERGITKYDLSHVAVVLDRGQGAEQAQEAGMHLHSLINLATDGLEWLKDSMVPQEHELISSYLNDSNPYFSDPNLKVRAIQECREFRGK